MVYNDLSALSTVFISCSTFFKDCCNPLIAACTSLPEAAAKPLHTPVCLSSFIVVVMLLDCTINFVLNVSRSFNGITCWCNAGVGFSRSWLRTAYKASLRLSTLSFLPLAIPRLHFTWAAFSMQRSTCSEEKKRHNSRW